MLLDAGASGVSEDDLQAHPSFIAMRRKAPSEALQHLKSRAGVNTSDKFWKVALFFAVKYNCQEGLKYLLDARAGVNTPFDKQG